MTLNSQPTSNKLLLLHGALGTTGQFAGLVDALAPEYELFQFNFSSHGGNVANARGFGIDAFAQEVIQFLDEHQIEKIDVFGYSMGGFVALKVAQISPSRIGKIITLGTKFDWTPESAQKEVKHLNPDKIIEKVPKFGHFLAKTHGETEWKLLMKKTADMMLDLGSQNVLETTPFEQILHEITIGIGTEDNMVSLSESEKVAKLLPNGTLEIFEGFKHPMEQIDVQVLRNVIRKQTSTIE